MVKVVQKKFASTFS